jgi:hypothetical protein
MAVGNRRRLADENEERRLKGVFREMVIAKDAPAHGQDQVAMPAQKSCKGVLVLPTNEICQELAIRQLIEVPHAGALADAPDGGMQISVQQAALFILHVLALYPLEARRARVYP